MGYLTGNQARLSFVITSTESTAPWNAAVTLVVTDPAGIDTRVTDTGLTTFAPTSAQNSSEARVAGWFYDVLLDQSGRWTYEFQSTGAVTVSDGGALAVRRPYASTST